MVKTYSPMDHSSVSSITYSVNSYNTFNTQLVKRYTGIFSNLKVDQKAQFRLAVAQAQEYQVDSPAPQAV
jgi:hypothetical protein